MSNKRHQPKAGSRNNSRSGKVVPLQRNPVPAVGLSERVAALEQNQVGIVRMFNKNMEAFKGGMLAVDAMLHVQQRILQDMASPRDVLYMEAGMIDVPRYLREYYGCAGFIEFISAWKEWRKTHHVVRLPDGSLDTISVEEIKKEQEAEEMAAAIAGPAEEPQLPLTEFGGDAMTEGEAVA